MGDSGASEGSTLRGEQVKDRPMYKQPWFVVSVSALLFLLFATAVGGESETVATNAGSAPQGVSSGSKALSGSQARPVGAVGVPIRDGKFEFVVNTVQCGIGKVGNGFLVEEAQGQFCVVSLTVRNIGDRAQTLYGSNQYLYNGAGQKFEANSSAAIKMGNSKSFIEAINPGNQVAGKIVYDLPAGVQPVEMELHDSMFSLGAKVRLQ